MPARARKIFLGAVSLVFSLYAWGAGWEQASPVPAKVRMIKFTANGDLYASEDGFEVRRSKDKGKTWEFVPGVGAAAKDDSIGLFVNAKGELIACRGKSQSHSGPYGVYRLINNGGSWKVATFLDTKGEPINPAGWAACNAAPCYATGDLIVATGSTRVFRSVDGIGDVLKEVENRPFNTGSKTVSWFGWLAVSANPVTKDLFLGCEKDYAGIWKSTDSGATWSYLGEPTAGNNKISFNSAGEAFDLTNQRPGVPLKWTVGTNWTEITGGLRRWLGGWRYTANDGDNMYMGCMTDTKIPVTFKSTDNGMNWAELPKFPGSVKNIRELEMGDDGYLYAGTDNGIWKLQAGRAKKKENSR